MHENEPRSDPLAASVAVFFHSSALVKLPLAPTVTYSGLTSGRLCTQSDPVGLAGGVNTYAYVGWNPLTFTDPNGLQRLPDYVTFELDAYVFSISATFPKYGDVFLGKGVGRPYPNPLSGGVSTSNGWKTSCSADGPSKDDRASTASGRFRPGCRPPHHFDRRFLEGRMQSFAKPLPSRGKSVTEQPFD